MINKVEFTAKNLTVNCGLLPLFEYINNTEIFQDIDENLKFDNDSTNEIKMNHIKTLLCGGLVGVDKLERFELLEKDPLIKELGIQVRKPENISRFLGNFNFKTTQMLRDIDFKVFKKLLNKSGKRKIVIDIDSRAMNVEGNQEGTSKGYNPGHIGNKCYNILMAFCDDLKAFISGFMRSGNTYTSNGAAELIKEIIGNLSNDVEDIVFRMDSGYFNEEIAEIIENAGFHYVVKAKLYQTLTEHAYEHSIRIWESYGEKQITMCCMKLDSWKKVRKFAVSRILKPACERKQLSLFESDQYTHAFYVTNTTMEPVELVKFYEKRGNCENYIKESKYDMNIGSLLMKSFWANEAYFQLMMLVYNIFLLFKLDNLSICEYRQQIRTFRLKYIFVAGKVVKTSRQKILQLQISYPYKKLFIKSA